MFKFNNRDTVSFLLTLNMFDTISRIDDVDFEQLNVCWVTVN